MSYTHTIVGHFPSHIEAGEFVILVTGSNEDVSQAKQMLDRISQEMSMPIAV